MSFRVDARRLDEAFLESVVAFTIHCGCVILQPDGKLIEPEVRCLRSAIEQSRAYLYCTAREQYYADLDSRVVSERGAPYPSVETDGE